MSEDLIRRSDVIKFLNDYLDDCYRVSRRSYEKTMLDAISMDFEAVITNIPTVEPKKEWTPVSERLPKATGFYICTVNRELFDVRTMKFEMLAEGGYRWLLRNGSEVFPSFVLAWMPLPPAYKGVDKCSSK